MKLLGDLSDKKLKKLEMKEENNSKTVIFLKALMIQKITYFEICKVKNYT